MIELTRLQNQPFVINADLIEFIEATPDTVISTTSGKKVIVRETVDDVVKKVMAYKRKILAPVAKRNR